MASFSSLNTVVPGNEPHSQLQPVVGQPVVHPRIQVGRLHDVAALHLLQSLPLSSLIGNGLLLGDLEQYPFRASRSAV